MKSKGPVKLGEAGPIVTKREVRRFVRGWVALVRWKRLRRRHKFPMKMCARWAGISLRTWRNVERGRGGLNVETLVRMMVAVNLTLEEVLTILLARKIKHLRRVSGRKNFASIRANREAGK